MVKDVVGAPFQHKRLPHINAIDKFHPNTENGTLKAVITPTIPKGFQTSIIKCSGLSELKIDPPMVRDIPQAIIQISITYCTSLSASLINLPTSKDNILAIKFLFFRNAYPICLTIYPLCGMGIYNILLSYQSPFSLI